MADSIHPPDVVLVNSNQTSPEHQPTQELCSPLSTAPNSPFRVSYEEDDDDDDHIQVRPEEIQELLDTPVSSKRKLRRPVEVPFDEGNNTPQRSAGDRKTATATTTIDPLLGDRGRSVSVKDVDDEDNNSGPAVVSPLNTSIQEDIDAYEEEEEDDDDDPGEKKEDSTSPPPTSHLRPPIYSGGYSSSSKNNNPQQQQPQQYPPRMVPPTMSEDDSVPHDERLCHTSPFSSGKDYIENVRNNADHNEGQSPMKEALQSAEREVQEMERRVQQMIEKRRGSSPLVGVTPGMARDADITSRNSSSNDKTQSTSIDPTPQRQSCVEEEEPPSLSPHRGDVHTSLDSGCSSYYYDGSAVGSISSTTDDVNNTTLESTTSMPVIGGGNSGTRVTMSIHPPLVEEEDPLPTIHNGSSSSHNKVIGSGGSNKDLGYYSQLMTDSASRSSRSASALESSREETFTSRFGSSSAEATNNSFAFVASQALNQVTDDLANFLVLPPSSLDKKRSRRSKKATSPPADQEYPPISPSQDSESTPHIDNLSPRRPTSSTSPKNDDVDMDLLYRQKPSAKLAKARSLVSGRHNTMSSPTGAPYLKTNGTGSSNSNQDPKQRARQVMNKRERERPSSATRGSSGSDNRDAAETSAAAVGAATAESLKIPTPPTIYRNIATMMEGLGGSGAGQANDIVMDKSGGAGQADWPTSVSQFVEEYQTAISESLRNLTMDEISGLAQNAEFGKDKMVAPGVVLSPSRDMTRKDTNSFDAINKFSNLKDEEYDALMQEITFGACLQMPELDHPAITTTRNNSTAQQATNSNDYSKGALQYSAPGLEYQYHSHSDEQQDHHPLGEDLEQDPEHQERAVFAKQLSERLMNLGPEGSSMNSSPEKTSASNGASFDSKDSSFVMSPPMRGDNVNQDFVSDIGGSKSHQGGLFVSNMPRNGDLPHSGQPSVSSDGYGNSPSRLDRSSRAKGKNAAAEVSFNSVGSISDIKPTMVQSIDNTTGIAKGDVMLSLLCDNSFQASDEKPDSWAWRVREAIWRGRAMRRDCAEIAISRSNSQDDGDGRRQRPIRQSSSLPVDVDDVRVVGGIKNVSSIQEKALTHLERDEFEEALELYEDIIFNYYSFFEQVLAKRNEFSSEDVSMELANFKPYIGASLHNLGVIHLLKGDYEDAFSFFKRAVDNRRTCLGEAHPDCVTSLVRLATCRFAMDNFAEAHTSLELSLALAGSKARTTNDYSQLGEILNNLGCLSYMCGQPTKAMKLFRESLDVQLAVLNSTLYGGTRYSAHTATLNLSVTRGNIGFLALVLRDVSSGILALEAALREQRLLLTGAHVTLVSTMDHLAVANLLEGRTQKAIKMLRRIYELQKAAHGPNDPRCFATRQKIMSIRGTEREERRRDSPGEKARQQRRHHEEEAKSSPLVGQEPDANAVEVHSNINPSNAANIGGASKVNSVFKAIRSLGRKKN